MCEWYVYTFIQDHTRPVCMALVRRTTGTSLFSFHFNGQRSMWCTKRCQGKTGGEEEKSIFITFTTFLRRFIAASRLLCGLEGEKEKNEHRQLIKGFFISCGNWGKVAELVKLHNFSQRSLVIHAAAKVDFISGKDWSENEKVSCCASCLSKWWRKSLISCQNEFLLPPA